VIAGETETEVGEVSGVAVDWRLCRSSNAQGS